MISAGGNSNGDNNDTEYEGIAAHHGTELRAYDERYMDDEKKAINARLARGEKLTAAEMEVKSSAMDFITFEDDLDSGESNENEIEMPIIHADPNYVYSSRVDASPNTSANQITLKNVEAEDNTLRLDFDHETILRFRIDADQYDGGILRDFFLAFDVPDIYSFIIGLGFMSTMKTFSPDFRWIDNMGTTLISKIRFTLGNFTEEYTGEEIRTMILRDTEDATKLQEFYEDIGNVPEMYWPETTTNSNETIYPSVVPITDDDNINNSATSLDMIYYRTAHSISGRTLKIPLKPFFDRATRIGLPCFMWQHQSMDIRFEITLRPVKDLYTVRDISNPEEDYPRIKPDTSKLATRLKLFTQFPTANLLRQLGDRSLDPTQYPVNDFSSITGGKMFTYKLWFKQIDINLDERLDYMHRLTEQGIAIPITRFLSFDQFRNIDFTSSSYNTRSKDSKMPIGGKRVLSIMIKPQRDDVDLTNQWTNFTTRREKYNTKLQIVQAAQLEKLTEKFGSTYPLFTYNGVQLNNDSVALTPSYDNSTNPPTYQGMTPVLDNVVRDPITNEIISADYVYYPNSRGIVDIWDRQVRRPEIIQEFSMNIDDTTPLHNNLPYTICRSLFRDHYKGTLDEGVILVPFSNNLSDPYAASGFANLKPFDANDNLILEFTKITQPMYRVTSEIDNSGLCVQRQVDVVNYDYGYNYRVVVEVQSFIKFNNSSVNVITEIF